MALVPPKANLKLAKGWIGPYFVEKKVNDVLSKIKLQPESRFLIVHVDHLKPYLGRKVPNGWENEIADFAPGFEEVQDENVSNGTEEFDLSDHMGSYLDTMEIPNVETPDTRETTPSHEAILPMTPPRRTRCGRSVKKTVKFSPTL